MKRIALWTIISMIIFGPGTVQANPNGIEPAFRNLELIYIRDRHSDRLHTVSLRFSRYLVEHSLGRILKRLSKSGLLTADETARLAAVAEASGGKNLYLMQELARQVPAGESK